MCCPFYNHGKSNREAASEFSCSNAQKKLKFLTQISPGPADGKQKSAWFTTFLPSSSYLEQDPSLSAFRNATEYFTSLSDKKSEVQDLHYDCFCNFPSFLILLYLYD